MTRHLLVLLALLLAHSVVANEGESENWYQVELIVFEHVGSDTHVLRYEESQYRPPEERSYVHFYTLGKPLSEEFQLVPLKAEERVLGEAYSRLSQSSKTRTILYQSWLQEIPRNQSVAAMKLAAGPVTGGRYQTEGQLSLKRNRYVHAELSLYHSDFWLLPYQSVVDWLMADAETAMALPWLAIPADAEVLFNANSSPVAYNTVVLKQSRRIKDGELHYIDHPAIGAIVTVKEIPAPFSYGTQAFP